MIHARLGCSTISFRHLPLPQGLATIGELGFAEIDLGALPGVCDHVPYVLGPHIATRPHPRGGAGEGNINLSVGNGAVDIARGFKALADAGYHGHFSLELETRDITHDERPAAAAKTARLISDLI